MAGLASKKTKPERKCYGKFSSIEALKAATSAHISGEIKDAELLYKQVIKMSGMDSVAFANLGVIYKQKVQLDKALSATLKAIEIEPGNAGIHMNLGSILQDQGKLKQALSATLKAIELQPDYSEAHKNLGGILKDQGELDQALNSTLKAIELKPDNVDAYINLGFIFLERGQLDKAHAEISKAIELNPDDAVAHIMLGRIEEANGNLCKTKQLYSRSIEINPHQGWAYFEISKNLLSAEEAISILELIDGLSEAQFLPNEKMLLAFASSNCHHRLNEFSKSAINLSVANDIKLMLRASEKNSHISSTERMLKPGEYHCATSSTCGKGRIFIVGMPRCGSTLVESILSVNSLAVDLGETKALSKAIIKIRTNENTSPCCTLEEFYLDQLKISSEIPEISLDKQLYNYMNSGIIARSMPAARIIHCRRNPLDNILSMFRANLTNGNNYTSSLEDSAEVLISQEQAMKHFKHLFPSSIYTLSYESLVNDPHHEIRRLLAWLEWDWNDDYLEPHKSSRSINTASVIQARKPINNKSVGGWKNYAEMLEPARRLLVDSGLFANDI